MFDWNDAETIMLRSRISHQIILCCSALDKTDQFEESTPKQRELAVTTAIKSFVSFMSALEALNLAVYSCKENTQRSQNAWDGGVALLIGSIGNRDTSNSAMNQTEDGRMFFSISEGLCDHFDTCTEDGSTVTDDLVALLTQGQGYIKDSLCSNAFDNLGKILQSSEISLIQNAIYYAEESIDEDTLGAGFIAAMAVLPFVYEIDVDASIVIKKDMSMRTSSADGEAGAVLNAFAAFLNHPLSEIDCNDVSNVHQLCNDTEIPVSVNLDEPTIISDGLYTASNYVQDRATIALDIRDIEEKVKADDLYAAVNLYNDGLNSPTYSSVGQLTGKRSVSKFSTDAAKNMMTNPLYNRYLFGLSDRNQGTWPALSLSCLSNVLQNAVFQNFVVDLSPPTQTRWCLSFFTLETDSRNWQLPTQWSFSTFGCKSFKRCMPHKLRASQEKEIHRYSLTKRRPTGSGTAKRLGVPLRDTFCML